MDLHGFLSFFVLSVLPLLHGVNSSSRGGASSTTTTRPMFVFGSSFVDTGNVPRQDSARPYPWEKPYGQTWPRKPSGRYSNGHVLSDVIAIALKLSPPVSFATIVPGVKYPSGVNFAIGESGVLSAYGYPSLSAQIDKLQSIISQYTKVELASAVVLYATAGDDYLHYLNVRKAPLSGIYPLTISVGKQISTDLIRLYSLGLRKFAVTYLPPMGCLPIATVGSNFQRCNESWNSYISNPHNGRVFKNALGLRHYFKNGTIVLLDLYSAFQTTISSFGLQPCCMGTGMNRKCGNVGAMGTPQYNLCPNSNSLFFWDDIAHPSEAGWQGVLNLLQPSLFQLLK